jgi:hypothetical protein
MFSDWRDSVGKGLMANQQQQQQERRRNLRLDFTRPYERTYNQQRGETDPVQSGFVSSTKWNTQDSKWYKAQTVTPTNGPIQDSKVTCGRDERTDSLLRQFFCD